MAGRVIAHVDMDAFFAAVEVRENPSLRGKPVLVAGAGRRGVVCAASYEARRYGCHSAQPTAVATRRCPQAVVVPPRHRLYASVSAEIFEIFARYSPLVEGLSIDEAFIDLTGTRKLLGTPRRVAESIRADVRAQTGLTCSVGLSAVKFVAKIASAYRKPDGLTEVLPEQTQAFLDPLPIRKLWGVGPKLAEKLTRRGVRVVADLAALDPMQLRRELGEHGAFVSRLSRGIDNRPVAPGRVAKSIGHEDTFTADESTLAGLRRRVLAQCQRVADRLVGEGVYARRVTLKLRDTDFRTQTRQGSLLEPTQAASVLYQAACALLDKLELRGRRFRLTGLSASEFSNGAPAQLSLLEQPALDLSGHNNAAGRAPRAAPTRRDDHLQRVLTAVRTKFGADSLQAGDTLNGSHADDSTPFTE